MKRALSMAESVDNNKDTKLKKIKLHEDSNKIESQEQEEDLEALQGSGFTNLDDNLIFEVFKHVDARTLGMASCVSKQWYKTAQDERLWELICTRHWNNIGCGNQQLRSVVLALGGFRRLHSLYIWPLIKPPPLSSSSSLPSASASASCLASSSSRAAPLRPMTAAKPHARWGKDEVNLSLSLLSIRFYEKMNYSNRGSSSTSGRCGKLDQ